MLLLLASVVFVFALSVLLGFTLYFRFSIKGRKLAKLPGPKAWPLVGNGVVTCFLNPVTSFAYGRNLRVNHGPIAKIISLHLAVLNIYDHTYAEKLLSTFRFNTKKSPYTFMAGWLGEGLLISNGEKWKQRRKLLTPAFHFAILNGFCSTFNEQTKKFLQTLDKETGKDRTDIVPVISRTTLSVMGETSMGTSVNAKINETLINNYFDAILTFGRIMQERVTVPWLHLDWVHRILPLYRTEKKLITDLHAVTNNIIKAKRNSRDNNELKSNDKNYNDNVYTKKRLAMLDHLLELEKNGDIDEDGIREEVDTFMFEGHDTTSSALSFLIMRIANETEVQERIYEELHQIFGDSQKSPTVKDFAAMKYLECCIKESMRIYPPVPMISRNLSEDLKLGEHILPEGAVTFIHIFDIHRNPALFPEPEKFIPERFLPENCVGRHPYAYLPFSAGPRNCIGQKFAMYELKTVMAGLLRKYRLEPVTKPEDIVFVADLVLRSKDPLYVRIRRRKT